MSLGLKKATNKMAMARGAKFMKVHNLPGWYNKNANLFGKTKEKLSKENRALRYKLKQANATLAITRMAAMAAGSKSKNAKVTRAASLFKLGRAKGALRNANAKLAIASMSSLVANSKKPNSNVKRAAALFKIALSPNGIKRSNALLKEAFLPKGIKRSNALLKEAFLPKGIKRSNALLKEAFLPGPVKRSNALLNVTLSPGPIKRSNSILKESSPRWNKPRQPSVRTYNKSNLKKNFKSSIGPNANGFGWAKIENSFYPLVGTKKKGGGYVINKFGKMSPAKYNSVVKGFLVW
jgi:hypothetical protein